MPPGVSAAAAAAKAAVENGLGKVGIPGCPNAAIGFALANMNGILFCIIRPSPSAGRFESGGENSEVVKLRSLFFVPVSWGGDDGGDCMGLDGS